MCVERLQQLWESDNGPPELEAFLAACPQLPPSELLEVFLTDQPYRWRSEHPLTTEQYLTVCPQLADHSDLLLDLLYGEYRARVQRGETPDVAELAGRFPHLSERLRRQLEISSWLDAGAADDRPAPEARLVGSRFGDYELCAEIARGGMGVIFRARHVPLNRMVALKMIRPERLARPSDVRRFQNETTIVARLDHPHIIPILDVGEVEGIHFFTMKLVEGVDLQQRRTHFLQNVQGAARLVAAVASAVHFAHQRGILHRDLKPSNVLVDPAGTPYVVDFGLARQLTAPLELTQSDEFVGTPAYLAPEQLAGDRQALTVAADVYGLGAILYVLLTGHPPFGGPTILETLSRVRDSEPRNPRALNPRIDPDLEVICLKALEKQPSARYSSAKSLAEDLNRYLNGEPIRGRPVGLWERRWRWIRRHPGQAAVAGSVSLAALMLLVVISILTLRLARSQSAQEEALTAARASRIEADAHHREAEAAQDAAGRLQREAEQARAEALTLRRQARESLYVSDIRLASAAWQTGNPIQMTELLDRHRPREDGVDVRGFEWFFLKRLPAARGPIFLDDVDSEGAHDRTLTFLPDGRRLAVACDAGVRIWDVETRRLERTLTDGGQPRDQVAVSPDGRLLAAGQDQSAVVEVWRLDTNSKQPAWRVGNQACGQLVFSTDNKLLAVPNGSVNELAIYDAATGGRSLRMAASQCRSAAYSHDGRWLAFTAGNAVVVWDWPNRRPARELQGHVKPVNSVAFSPDGSRLASGGEDRHIHLWDAVAGELIHTMTGHTGAITQIAFVGDDRLVSAADDSTIRAWHVPLGELLCTLQSAPTHRCHRLAVSPTHRHLACRLAAGQVQLLDISRP
jgi:tRNA A-37 threonylcarbamoyl transferase component Bud32